METKKVELNEEICLELLKGSVNFLQSFDRVPGSLALSWHQNLEAIIAVHNFIGEKVKNQKDAQASIKELSEV